MASRLRRRVIHFANLPLKLMTPSSPSLDNIKEIAFKTIPSASKIEIKRVLESLYGFEVAKVQTLNMQGKQKRRGGFVYYKPDYKKAYVTLKKPLSLQPHLFPIDIISEAKEDQKAKSQKTVEMKTRPTHWLDDKFEARKENLNGKATEAQAQKKQRPWHNKFAWR